MKVKKTIQQIFRREKINKETLHLTAYENQVSEVTNYFLGSKLSERYYFGGGKKGVVDMYPFNCLGMPEVEELVKQAESAMNSMLGGKCTILNCLSGVHAMMSTILSISDPGDCVMTIHHDDGGHFATEGILKRTGRRHVFAKFDLKNLNFDATETAKIFKKNKCKVLYLDFSYYINAVNISELRNELGKNALIVFDASHTMGLLMGGKLQSPLIEGADLICANTHKTLPGPQKGVIVFKDKQLGEKVREIILSNFVSSSHTHHLIALAITILEMKDFGKEYASQLVKNSQKLGEELTHLGYQVRKNNSGRFSDTHQVHLFLPKAQSKSVYKNLVKNNISTNFDIRQGNHLFARLGTQEVTRRGMKEAEMVQIADILDKAIKGKNVQKEVESINSRFASVKYGYNLGDFDHANK